LDLKISPSTERRGSVRFEASCRCWVEHDALTLFGTVTNISSTGIFLRTLPVVEKDAVIDIRLNMDSGDVVAQGRIRWANKELPGPGEATATAPLGLGIEFITIKDGHEVLNRYFARKSITPVPDTDLFR